MNLKIAFRISLQLLFVIFQVATAATTETEENRVYHKNVTGEKNQVDTDVSPMVLLLYTQNNEHFLMTYTDLETMKTTDFAKLSPLNYIELAGVALLCPASVEQEDLKDVFLLQSTTERIETDKVYRMCKRSLKPMIFRNDDSMFYKIGYKVKNPELDETDSNTPPNAMEKVENTEANKTDSNTLQTSTNEDVEKDSKTRSEIILNSPFSSLGSEPREIHNLELSYDFGMMIPTMSTHLMYARMYSNDYNKSCDDFTLGLDIFEDEKIGFKTTMFSNLSVTYPDYILHQLVPIQDFKGEYATVGTCTYLNFTLLHKHIVEGPLRDLEILLRDIADITGILLIVTGTLKRVSGVSTSAFDEETISIPPTETGTSDIVMEVSKSDSDKKTISIPTAETETSERVSEVANSDSDHEIISIPTIFWKKITYVSADMREFSILMVIHNKETTRLCDTNKINEELGWPKSDPNQKGIGTIYYCLVDEVIMDELGISYQKYQREIEPFNLNKMPYLSSINILQVIEKAKNNGNSN